ncbi:MAG: amino acid permease, partial [Myxococcales bacterium]|nr:amino acid permease [Myxococcales bacterium]
MSERVEYEDVDAAYLEQRSLQRTAGPVLLWGLGVGYVISGDYFGWNYGLNAGGFGGLLVATALMATLYVTMIFSIAELATAMPVAGGPYAFARRALGPWGGYVTGLAVTIEYVVAPAVIATGIGGYVAGMFPAAPPWVETWVPVVAYAIFVGVSLWGSRVSLALLLGITVVSVGVLLVWAAAVLPHVQWSRLLDMAPVEGGSALLPKGGL